MEELKEKKKSVIQQVEKFNLDNNKKQYKFFKDVVDAVEGRSHKRFFFYGGAIRGGKTSICLFILHYLCCKYPKFKCHVIRQDTPKLDAVRSSFKLLFENSRFISRIPGDKSRVNIYVEYKNGSRIYFVSENYSNDKDLNFFKGLETNVILLEQMEELQESTFTKSIERIGSWRLPNPPPCDGLILGNFNPTWNWVKEKIHDKYRDNELPERYYYLSALPTDNPYVKDNQFDAWRELGEDSIDYRKNILGEWDVSSPHGRFMYSFDRIKHTGKCSLNREQFLYLSFDFNINPMSCLAIQMYNNKLFVVKEFLLTNIGIQEFVLEVKKWVPEDMGVYIGGDPTGFYRHGLSGHNVNYYTEIMRIMELPYNCLRVHKGQSPQHEDSQVICNKIFDIHPSITIDLDCKKLIEDLEEVKFSYMYGMERAKYSKIKEEGGTKVTKGHLLDCLRYFFHQHLKEYEKMTTKFIK